MMTEFWSGCHAAAFDILDVDGDGLVSASDLKKLLSAQMNIGLVCWTPSPPHVHFVDLLLYITLVVVHVHASIECVCECGI